MVSGTERWDSSMLKSVEVLITLTSVEERSRILRKWHDEIMKHEMDLASIVTAECGKPLTESKGEVNYGASFVTWFAEESKRCVVVLAVVVSAGCSVFEFDEIFE